MEPLDVIAQISSHDSRGVMLAFEQVCPHTGTDFSRHILKKPSRSSRSAVEKGAVYVLMQLGIMNPLSVAQIWLSLMDPSPLAVLQDICTSESLLRRFADAAGWTLTWNEVFEGDSLSLRCPSHIIGPAESMWMRKGTLIMPMWPLILNLSRFLCRWRMGGRVKEYYTRMIEKLGEFSMPGLKSQIDLIPGN